MSIYMARQTLEKPARFFIRQSYRDGPVMKSRDILALGTDPGRFVRYTGGHGYYFDDMVLDALEAAGLDPNDGDLDAVFFEFLRPDIQRVITGFDRGRRRSPTSADSADEPHLFDKRRLCYLRFGRPDQRGIDRMPPRVFRDLQGKSRDELEQYFWRQEQMLTLAEMAVYLYVIFELALYYRVPVTTPEDTPQARMDTHLIDQLCRLNEDRRFWAGMPAGARLNDYLVRYAVIYFDYPLPRRPAPHDDIWDFINRHRHYRPPPKIQKKLDDAARLFNMAYAELRRLDRQSLTRLYRKQALRHHPDHGGDPHAFGLLNDVYRALLRRAKGSTPS